VEKGSVIIWNLRWKMTVLKASSVLCISLTSVEAGLNDESLCS